MKTIGLIGGMSWESTLTYYQVINEAVKREMGGLHSAKLVMYSVEFAELESNMSAGNWDRCAEILTDAAKRLQSAGADFILICTNTLHKVAPQVQKAIDVPILHIAEAAVECVKARGFNKIALLGTKYTMTQDFIRDVITASGIDVITPDAPDMEIVNHVIFDELCRGIISEESKKEYLRIIDKLAQRGAQGVILGCTEIGMLVNQHDTSVPLFDTTIIHAEAAAKRALA